MDIPNLKSRNIKITGILFNTQADMESIEVRFNDEYTDINGKVIFSTTKNLSFKKYKLYQKNGKYYSVYARAINHIAPSGIVTAARDQLYNGARDLVFEYLEQIENKESGTYLKNKIDDPDAIDLSSATPEELKRLRIA